MIRQEAELAISETLETTSDLETALILKEVLIRLVME
jgi:hypothetical protein